jgi:autotransporter-associated beta strand protein
MKPRRLSAARLSFPLASAIAALLAASAPKAEAQLFYKSTTAANSWTGNFWGTSAAGPFNGAWVSGSNVTFVANGGTTLALTGATTQFASITADENVNVTASGTLGTGGTVATVTVATGKNMNFGTQAISTAAGTGLIKNGAGTLTLAGGTYAGGFTLNAGTIAVGGVNAMGAGGSLTMNGGTIRSNSATARDLTGKYAGGITIGGDFTLGDATNNGALTFTNSVALGAATRTITVNSAASFGGVVSGAASAGLTKAGTGALTLSGANTFDGVVTINAGTLSINSFPNGGVAGSLGMSSNAATNLVMNTGTLSYTGGSTTTDRGITFGALTGNPIISITAAAANLNLTSAIVGTPGQQIDFTKGGGGTLTLSNDNNSYIGRTFASGGTLAVSSISAVGAGNSSIGVATSASTGLISIGSGAVTATLSHIGTGSTTDRDLDLPGTTGGGIISQSGTGLLKFTGTFGASGAGSKTLTLTGSTAGTGEIGSVIVDNSVTNITALTKAGTGTWTLSGANTYTGATTVGAGILVVTGSLASNVTVGGGTLDLGGGTAGGSLSSPTLTLNGGTLSYTRTGGTTQGFTTTTINGPSQLSVVAGNTLDLGTIVRGVGGTLDFAAAGAGTVAALAANNVNGIMPGFSYGDTWAVANGAGLAISGLGSYTLTSVAGTTGANYLNGNVDVDNDAGLIDAAIAANSVRFSAAAANTLTLAAGTNTIASGGILVGSTVAGNPSTITGGSLTGAASQNLAIIQNNTLGGLTLSSTIVDNTVTSVTKSGAGVLTLDAANTYTGGTTISAGTVKLSGAGTLGPAAASVAVNSGALFDLNGTNQSITLAAGSGVGMAANNSGSGTSVLTLKATAAPDGSFLTIADNTSTPGGTVAVVITSNTQTPSNLNSYSGGTTVNAGAFFYMNASSPNGAGTGPISLPASGATTSLSSGLLVDGGGTYANDVSGAGYIHNNSNGVGTAVLTGTLTTSGTFNFRNAAAAFNFAGSGNSTLSGIIGPVGASNVFGPNTTVAGGSIIKSGTGTLTLSGANAYTGSTTINGGTLRVSGGGAIPNAGLVTLADASGVSFEVPGSETIGALAGGGATGGAVSIDASQTLTLSSGTQTYAGTISGAGTLTNSGAIQTLNGALSHTGGVNVTAGTLTLGNPGNTYSGATVISAATVIVTADGALGATGLGNETTVTGTAGATGPRLAFSGGINYATTERIIGTGSGDNRGFIQSANGNNTFAGEIELSADGNSRIGSQDGAQLTLTGTITQASGITTANILFRVGNLAGDFVTLSNAGNSLGGDSSVFTSLAVAGQYAGLRIGVDNAHPTNLTVQNFSTASGASTALDLNGNDQALNGLASGGAGALNIINLDTVNASTLTLDPTVDKNSGANIVILGGSPGGTPLGEINLVKDGAFTQTLTGANSYTGTTTVNNGTLTLGNAAALGASSVSVAGGALNLGGQTITNAVSVGAAGTLTGSGSTGAATLAGGLTPGGSGSGLITLASASVASTSSVTLQLPATGTRGTNYDALTVSGALALDGTITVDVTGLTPAAGQSFDLIDATGSIDLTAFNVATDLVLPALGGGLVWDTAAFATTGVISIVSGDPFPAWAASKGLTGAPGFESGKGDDPDKDGRTNLDEFAFDGDPLSGANDGKVVGKIATVGADQVMTLTLPVRSGATFSDDGGDELSALVDGIYYRVEGSVNLSAFADNVTEVTPTLSAGLPSLAVGWTYRTFRASGTVPSASKTFLRAKVSETP